MKNGIRPVCEGTAVTVWHWCQQASCYGGFALHYVRGTPPLGYRRLAFRAEFVRLAPRHQASERVCVLQAPVHEPDFKRRPLRVRRSWCVSVCFYPAIYLLYTCRVAQLCALQRALIGYAKAVSRLQELGAAEQGFAIDPETPGPAS